jgi:hypothetical protein
MKKKDDGVRTFKYDRGKGARSIARERVGQPPPSKVITPKKLKKTKHKKRGDQALEA